ncbi:MAG TPA: ATP-binding protein [Casimicrobiaceae bacterium]|nr:ATP-binding protein [Casimicrobiaceae bacterium]
MADVGEKKLGYLPRRIGILFACGLIAIVLDALLFDDVLSSFADWTRTGIATRTQLEQLDAARDALVDVETAVRAYLLTGNADRLGGYATAETHARDALARLASAPKVDAAQQAGMEQYAALARDRLDELRRSVEAYRAGSRDRSAENVAADTTKMDQIQRLGTSLQTTLAERIDGLRARMFRTIRWSQIGNLVATVVAAGILVFFGLTTIRYLLRRQRLEQRIQTSNIELERMVSERTQALADSAESLRAELAGRQRQEQKLRESEERFRLLVAGVKDYAIFRLDTEGYITSWNAGAERIKGYAASEVIGKHFSIFYTEEDRKAGVPQRALETAVREGRYEAEAGLRLRKDGTRFVANVVIDALRDDTGGLVGFAKITRDVTERHHQEAKLEEARLALAQSQKMEALGQLSGGIAHDFNNLLHVIKNAVAVLKRRLQDSNPDLAAAIDMIDRNADRAASLTQRLLAFSRRQPLQPQPLEPRQLVIGMAPLLESALGGSIVLEIERGKDTWPVSADASQLEIALLNLAVNARDAMPGGGRLTIEISNAYLDEEYAAAHEDAKPGEYTLIAVTDTGAGMTPEIIAKAFEPFFTTKDIGQGTGLGLSQVYGFIKQSGGHVTIDSEPGHGTTVRLYLPRLATAAPVEARAPVESPPPRRPSETILLVEDEDDVRSFTATILSGLGYRVLTASDASSALGVLETAANVDLLFTDVGLPSGLDGRQLVDEARKRWPDLKVLFTTGYARSALVHYGRLDSGIELIVKPFSEASLAKRIRAVLDGRRAAA